MNKFKYRPNNWALETEQARRVEAFRREYMLNGRKRVPVDKAIANLFLAVTYKGK